MPGFSLAADQALLQKLEAAWTARSVLRQRFVSESTNCFRVFHGIAEGEPGLNIDCYGTLMLVQCQRSVPDLFTMEELHAWGQSKGMPHLVVLDRSGHQGQVVYSSFEDDLREVDRAPINQVKEFGARYSIDTARIRLDPQLFLDTRALRRRILALKCKSRALNLFCYTGSLGIVAELAGAKQTVQVDFSQATIKLAQANASINGCNRQDWICEEVYPTLWQMAGRALPQMRGRKPPRPLTKQTFGLIIIDPPQRSKGRFGAVDLKNDYPSLIRPSLEILDDGGTLLAVNNLSSVTWDQFAEMLTRSCAKSGRTLKGLTRIQPESDFPSPDGQPPLKIAELTL